MPQIDYRPAQSRHARNADGSFGESARSSPTGSVERRLGRQVRTALDILTAEMIKTREGGKSELMDTLIAYWWKDMFKPYDRDPAEIQWK